MAPPHAVVELRGVRKVYDTGAVQVEALRHIDLSFFSGEYISIMGPSGCGKSTLLNLLGCLDTPSHGDYLLDGVNVSHLDDDALSALRGQRLGFVFQSYNLIPQLTVVENIEVPLFYQGVPADESRETAIRYAELVGLGNRLHHRPAELSGGQQQRVGIARALANDPVVILADEPTGNLDSKSGTEILALFDDLHAEGKTLILVTHDPAIGERSQRIVRLRDGEVESDVRR